MNKAVYILVSGFVFVFLMGLVPETASPKAGPRTIVLNEANTVSLNVAIDSNSASETQLQLMKKASHLPSSAPLYLILNSPGGSIVDGEKIIETAQGLPNPIHTISIFSASMSFIISQYLDRRLIVESGTMMSHRAYAEGIGGQIPGNLVTRTLGLLSAITQMDTAVAKRVGMAVTNYQEMIRDEAWLRGQEAVNYHFADEVVRIQCDRSLSGPGPEQIVDLGLFKVVVRWHLCPLITRPFSVAMSDELTEEQRQQVNYMLYDKAAFVRQYGAKTLTGGVK